MFNDDTGIKFIDNEIIINTLAVIDIEFDGI